MSVTQKDLFGLLLENSENGQVQVNSISSDTHIFADLIGDSRGNLFATPFRSDQVDLNISIRMKREIYLQISDLLSKVIA
jgi:hypothetical protein